MSITQIKESMHDEFKNQELAQKTEAKNNGYTDYYQNVVAQNQASYNIVLGTDGIVYVVTDYWQKNSKADEVYKKAPSDMQKAYQDLLEKYGAQTSQMQSSSNKENTPKGMSVTVIQNGDFSSVAGNWKNGKGTSLIFDKSGLVSPEDSEVTFNSATKLENGYLITPLRTGKYGAELLFIPSGVALPDQVVDGKTYTDHSNTTKDRLLVTQQIAVVEDSSSYYYKVD